ncbi:hypothetical protein N9R81_06315 [Flavobacteriales bacterium]|nr:hypothetical protein [Flavobacteriales bacterium]
MNQGKAPESSNLIGGVCSNISKEYHIHVLFVRSFILLSFITVPLFPLVIYTMLWKSIGVGSQKIDYSGPFLFLFTAVGVIVCAGLAASLSIYSYHTTNLMWSDEPYYLSDVVNHLAVGAVIGGILAFTMGRYITNRKKSHDMS